MKFRPDDDPFILRYDDCSRQNRLFINPSAEIGELFQALCLLAQQECLIVPDSHTPKLFVTGGAFNRADILQQLAEQPIINETHPDWQELSDKHKAYRTHVLSMLLATGQSLYWLQQMSGDIPRGFVPSKAVEEIRLQESMNNLELVPVYQSGTAAVFITLPSKL